MPRLLSLGRLCPHRCTRDLKIKTWSIRRDDPRHDARVCLGKSREAWRRHRAWLIGTSLASPMLIGSMPMAVAAVGSPNRSGTSDDSTDRNRSGSNLDWDRFGRISYGSNNDRICNKFKRGDGSKISNERRRKGRTDESDERVNARRTKKREEETFLPLLLGKDYYYILGNMPVRCNG